jgi:hypothetical protein
VKIRVGEEIEYNADGAWTRCMVDEIGVCSKFNWDDRAAHTVEAVDLLVFARQSSQERVRLRVTETGGGAVRVLWPAGRVPLDDVRPPTVVRRSARVAGSQPPVKI